jgi:hypothetical protein
MTTRAPVGSSRPAGDCVNGRTNVPSIQVAVRGGDRGVGVVRPYRAVWGALLLTGPDGRYVAVGRDSAGLDARSGTQRAVDLGAG